MKPVKLEFEGINSFSEHTIIDFEKLSKSGIFGIFGDTGSGKSTILDCINFALYGRVERSKEKTDIINYRCNSANVKFTFTIVNCGKRKTYFVERTLKNDKSGTHKAVLYEDGACIADKASEVEKKITDILGLEAEDFRKCIALPQGEFSQFVKSAPRDRLALIERLFNLSVYGDKLKEKISAKREEADGEYKNICGKYSAYENVTQELADRLCEESKELESRLSETGEKVRAAAETYNSLKSLYDKRIELEENLKKFSDLERERPQIELLKKDLAVLPVCRETVTVSAELTETQGKLYETGARLSEETKKLEDAKNSVKRLETAIEQGRFEERAEEYAKLSAKYLSFAGKPEKLEKLGKELLKKREEYAVAEAEREKLAKDLRAAKNNEENLKSALGGGQTDELENLVNIEFKGAVLRREYVSALDDFVDLRARTESYYEDSDLYKFIQKELGDRIELFKQRISAVKDFKLENVNRQFELFRNAIKEREETSRKLLAATSAARDAEGKLNVNAHRLETLKKDGVELKRRYEELKAELDEAFGENCGDYAAAERENAEKLGQIKAERQRLGALLEKAEQARAQSVLNCEKLKTQSASLKERIAALAARVEVLTAKSGLGGISECVELAKKFESYADAEKVVNEFDLKYASVSARKDELSEINGINAVKAEDVSAALKIKQDSEAAFSGLNGEAAVTAAKLKELNGRLKEKDALTSALADAKKRLDLIERLKEITKNNRFLEYVADEYLCDISSAASSTLLKLTDGRYFLLYKDNNFNVGDNFDCGNLRGVNTLSGGETFLVSLSLALALSQTICASSLKSIEFFFLDEGFGTLDSTLVDTVMNSLEKLKSEQFTIGVISHVEELKHRIDSKITVIKATESHGSTVQTSC